MGAEPPRGGGGDPDLWNAGSSANGSEGRVLVVGAPRRARGDEDAGESGARIASIIAHFGHLTLPVPIVAGSCKVVLQPGQITCLAVI
jgi:hypothetical protein